MKYVGACRSVRPVALQQPESYTKNVYFALAAHIIRALLLSGVLRIAFPNFLPACCEPACRTEILVIWLLALEVSSTLSYLQY